jgi:magnesium transporter
VGERRAEAVGITVIEYDQAEVHERQAESAAECAVPPGRPTVTWINVDGLHDVTVVESLAEHFGLHPLVQEDILNTTQRPKCDDHGDYVYAVLDMFQWDAKEEDVVAEQVSLILGPNVVISFQEREGDVFGPIRERIRHGAGRIRRMPADYLAYCLIDAIVDGTFAVLERVGEKIEAAEESLVRKPTPTVLRDIHRLKREAVLLRRSVWPLREVIADLERNESARVSDATRVYLRDVRDHAVQAIDILESFREMLGGMLDTYLSSLSTRMNEVMKVLTIIATIFIPLSFIAGVYGMNFEHMPELGWWWGYPACLAAMALAAGGMLFYFWRRKWL